MFAGDKDVVMKWCQNRPQQSKNTASLKRMANLSVHSLFRNSFDHEIYLSLKRSLQKLSVFLKKSILIVLEPPLTNLVCTI